jgi:hypothetical protein
MADRSHQSSLTGPSSSGNVEKASVTPAKIKIMAAALARQHSSERAPVLLR